MLGLGQGTADALLWPAEMMGYNIPESTEGLPVHWSNTGGRVLGNLLTYTGLGTAAKAGAKVSKVIPALMKAAEGPQMIAGGAASKYAKQGVEKLFPKQKWLQKAAGFAAFIPGASIPALAVGAINPKAGEPEPEKMIPVPPESEAPAQQGEKDKEATMPQRFRMGSPWGDQDPMSLGGGGGNEQMPQKPKMLPPVPTPNDAALAKTEPKTPESGGNDLSGMFNQFIEMMMNNRNGAAGMSTGEILAANSRSRAEDRDFTKQLMASFGGPEIAQALAAMDEKRAFNESLQRTREMRRRLNEAGYGGQYSPESLAGYGVTRPEDAISMIENRLAPDRERWVAEMEERKAKRAGSRMIPPIGGMV